MVPAELESVLLSHPSIADAAVIGLPSELHGQLPHAWAVLRQGTVCSEKEVIKWIEGALGHLIKTHKTFFIKRFRTKFKSFYSAI